MALLEFLARAAPAGVVAADALVLIHVPGLDVRQKLGGVLIRVFHSLRRDAAGGRGSREGARLIGGRAARVGEVARGAGVAGGAPGLGLVGLARAARAVAVAALDLHLHAEDVAG